MIIEWIQNAYGQLSKYVGLPFWRNYISSTIVITTPSFRTVVVAAESRTIIVAAESRVVTILAETRTTEIED